MAHRRSSVSPARALLRVLCSDTRHFGHFQQHNVQALSRQSRLQLRHASFMHLQKSGGGQAAIDPFPNVVRDDAIKAPYVQMPLPEGGLTRPEPLRSVLSRVKMGKEHLVQLSEGMHDSGVAICRITPIAHLLQRKRDREKIQKEQKKSAKQSIPKQIELNWAIGPHDLAHKLAQLKPFVDDGRSVEIVLATKRRQRKASHEEGNDVLAKVMQALVDADAREVKPRQGGQVGKHTTLTVKKKGLE